MAGKDIVEMSVGELKRLRVIQKAIDRLVTQKTAAEAIGISERQVRRLIRAVRQDGDLGISHKGRGKSSNRKIADRVKSKAIKLYRKKYGGFGPTLFAEKLKEIEGIETSKETLRQWLMEEGLWEKRRRRKSHRQWRPRRECFGSMLQMDGSEHDWLEGRGPEMVLMGYIDDATNNVYGRFYDYEGTRPAMDSFKRYIGKYGLPQSVYFDRHTTYKSTSKLTDEEIMEGVEKPLSQFERALLELGVEVIHAYSPQAKGRIERLFGVLQDRLIKEMRLRCISSQEDANKFLEEYLPVYNKRFGRVAANPTDLHMDVPNAATLKRILSIRTERVVKNDNTVVLKGKLYLIEERVRTKKVVIEERLDGSRHITSQGVSLKYKEITERPVKKITETRKAGNKAKTPAKDHPWRKFDFNKKKLWQAVA